jgi:hypothetical protein
MAELQPTQKEVDLFEEKYGTTKYKLSFRLALRFHIPMWIWVVVLLFAIVIPNTFVQIVQNYGLLILLNVFLIQSSVEMSRQAALCELEYQKARFYMFKRQRRGYYEMIQEGMAGSGSYKLSYLLVGAIFTLANRFTNWVDHRVISGYLLGFLVVNIAMSYSVYREMSKLKSYKSEIEAQSTEVNDFRDRVIDELTDYVRERHGWYMENANGMTSDAAFAMAYVYEMLNENGVRELNGTLKEVLKDAQLRRSNWSDDTEFVLKYVEALVNLTPLVQETAPGRYPECGVTKAIVKEFLD